MNSVHPSIHRSVGATYVIFPNFGLIKLSIGQIKSKKVNSCHFGLDHGIDEEMNQKKPLIDALFWQILALRSLLLFASKIVG